MGNEWATGRGLSMGGQAKSSYCPCLTRWALRMLSSAQGQPSVPCDHPHRWAWQSKGLRWWPLLPDNLIMTQLCCHRAARDLRWISQNCQKYSSEESWRTTTQRKSALRLNFKGEWQKGKPSFWHLVKRGSRKPKVTGLFYVPDFFLLSSLF